MMSNKFKNRDMVHVLVVNGEILGVFTNEQHAYETGEALERPFMVLPRILDDIIGE